MSRVDALKRKAFEKHVLTEWRGGADVSGFCMREPGTMMMSCTILGYRDGVAIMGDIAPGRGVCIERKDIEWFSGELSESYLLEKASIPKTWQAECAAEWVRDWILQDEAQRAVEEWRALLSDLGSGRCDTPHDFAGRLEGLGYVIDDGLPGYDYQRQDASWLCAIQQRFRVLYSAWTEAAQRRAVEVTR